MLTFTRLYIYIIRTIDTLYFIDTLSWNIPQEHGEMKAAKPSFSRVHSSSTYRQLS